MGKRYKYSLAIIIFLIILTGGLYYYQQSFNIALRRSGFEVDSFILVDEQRVVHEENFSWASPHIGIARVKETGESVWISAGQPVNMTPPHFMDIVFEVPRILQKGFRSSWHFMHIDAIHDEDGRPAWIEWEEFNDDWGIYPSNIFFDEKLENYQLFNWGKGLIWNFDEIDSENIPRFIKIGVYGDSFLRYAYEALTRDFVEEDLSVELISKDDEFVLVLASYNESLLYFEAFELVTEVLRSLQ